MGPVLQFPLEPVGVAVAVTVVVWVGVPPQGAATGAGAGVATAKTSRVGHEQTLAQTNAFAENILKLLWAGFPGTARCLYIYIHYPESNHNFGHKLWGPCPQ